MNDGDLLHVLEHDQVHKSHDFDIAKGNQSSKHVEVQVKSGFRNTGAKYGVVKLSQSLKIQLSNCLHYTSLGSSCSENPSFNRLKNATTAREKRLLLRKQEQSLEKSNKTTFNEAYLVDIDAIVRGVRKIRFFVASRRHPLVQSDRIHGGIRRI